ncbi:MAG: hypothetical protein QOH90_1584, partial [Actinomycetota bacterium]|nr:hypothetical protein [Actinomycetota bacterium]
MVESTPETGLDGGVSYKSCLGTDVLPKTLQEVRQHLVDL